LQDALAAGWKALEERGRVLVAAVLRPEQREDGQLEVVRPAAEELVDALELTVGETELAVERLGDPRQTSESKRGSGQVRSSA
jgi:hypothetical protein